MAGPISKLILFTIGCLALPVHGRMPIDASLSSDTFIALNSPHTEEVKPRFNPSGYHDDGDDDLSNGPRSYGFEFPKPWTVENDPSESDADNPRSTSADEKQSLHHMAWARWQRLMRNGQRPTAGMTQPIDERRARLLNRLHALAEESLGSTTPYLRRMRLSRPRFGPQRHRTGTRSQSKYGQNRRPRFGRPLPIDLKDLFMRPTANKLRLSESMSLQVQAQSPPTEPQMNEFPANPVLDIPPVSEAAPVEASAVVPQLPPMEAPVAPSTVSEVPATPAVVASPSAPESAPSAPSGGAAGSQFQGDGTFYNPGVGTGSCGQLHQDSELVVALNKQQYGDMANPNLAEVCGKQVEIKGPKGSVRATIVDTCPVVGCGYGSLDLSPAAFEKIADFDTGRVPIQWSFV